MESQGRASPKRQVRVRRWLRQPKALPKDLSTYIRILLNRIPVDFGGGCSELKAEYMAKLVLNGSLKSVVDIGVYRGRSLLPLAAAVHWQQSGIAVGIDPYSAEAALQADTHEFGPRLAEWAISQDWEDLFQGVLVLINELGLQERTRILRETSADAARSFDPKTIDLVHIDGNHDTTAVAQDLRLYQPLVRPGGFIVLDDVSWQSVRPVYRQLRRSSRLVREVHGPQDDFAVFQVPF